MIDFGLVTEYYVCLTSFSFILFSFAKSELLLVFYFGVDIILSSK